MNFTQTLCDLAKEIGVKFTFDGKLLSNDAAFADTGFLPALASRADKLCLLCFGYGIGINFIDAEKSILGTKVQFDEVTPNVLRLAFFYEVIMGIVDAAPSKDQVSLDELMYD
jgi:intracellular multiplication protein IcmS